MPLDLHASPFLTQNALGVNQKGAALDAHVFTAIVLFQLDHVELLAQGFVLVAEQIEIEFLFGLEIFMAFDAVTRHPEDHRVLPGKPALGIAKILRFGGAAGGAVLGVEIKHDVLAGQVFQTDILAAGGGAGEVFDFFSDAYHVFAFPVRVTGFSFPRRD